MDANWTLKQVAFHPRLEQIKNLVEEFDPVLQAEVDQIGYRIAVLLLSAFAEGTNRHRLASFTVIHPILLTRPPAE